MPAQPIYRYFQKRSYAENFIDGQIRCCSLAEYRAMEDAVRGDRYEAQRIHKPEGGLVLQFEDGRRLTTDFTYSATSNSRDIFVLCTSLVLDAEQFARFNACCAVSIRSPGQLKSRINDALGQRFRGAPWELRSGLVSYYEIADQVGGDWAPHRATFAKLREGYSDQAEMRFAFARHDAFGTHAVKHELRVGGFEKPPADFPEPIVLQARPMDRFCTLIDR